MLDFYRITTHIKTNGVVEIRPGFNTGKRKDLMIKGGDFYAVWIEEKKLWSTDEDDVIQMIDHDLVEYAKENSEKFPKGYSIQYMKDADSGSFDRWLKYCQKQQRTNFVPLDEKIIFSNQETTREDYASKKLDYPLVDGDCPAYEKLISTLYSPEERMKIEWAIGAIVTGDSKFIQKFIVLYGDKGTGKSTIIKIFEKLFKGYTTSFTAQALGSSKSAFPLEPFKENPLVAIDPEAKLDKIDDNTLLNSLVAHDVMSVNTKYGRLYSTSFHSFLIMASNNGVKITDSKSGITRRLIDISPTGNLVTPVREYNRLMKQIDFELGAIAWHCKEVYLANKDIYDNYIPINMLLITNDFYNFMEANYQIFKKNDGVSLAVARQMYKTYCDEADVDQKYRYSLRVFREELRTYFRDCIDRYSDADGNRQRSFYKGFRTEKFGVYEEEIPEEPKDWLVFKEQHSLLDDILADCPAQEAFFDEDGNDRPKNKWEKCKTKLKDIDTKKLHYILQKGHNDLIRLDFDFKNSQGVKDPEINLKEANKWPKTYAERSKSGAGIHLYYIYQGDTSKLSRMVDSEIEIKVANGNSSIRRKLTVCNDIPIATISSGLPLKGDDKVVHNEKAILNERQLRTFIKRALNKEHHGHTKPEVDFIYKVLEDKYASGEPYDISDMRNAVLAFAASSTNQSKEAIKKVAQMKFKSKEVEEEEEATIPQDFMNPPEEDVMNKLIFFDCEVYPNFFCICWNLITSDVVHEMRNPTPDQVVTFIEMIKKYGVGFNCRRYDNHVIHAASVGGTNLEIFDTSQNIINNKQGFYGPAYSYSFTDIWDYCSNKQSLKKWEIQLGIDHKEVNYRWDEPLPEDKWDEVVSYCKNDVLATKAVWFATQSDFIARQILADLTGLTVNDTTNTLTGRLIFGNNKNPQGEFNYRDLSKPVVDGPMIFTAWNGEKSSMPFFPGYTFEKGKSFYRGEEVGEGGYVYAEPGIYDNVTMLDVASMHPHSAIAEKLFGRYTDIFQELVNARVYIKHAVAAHERDDMNAYEDNLNHVRSLPHLGDKFARYLGDFEKLKNLPQTLKIVINSVYGLTVASFNNPFRDPHNVDNIVAKRGALFMIDLKHAVQERGFTVAHIKTDSIKIPNATQEIIDFVIEFGKKYGYSFELDAEYEKMALVNDAVYIAKYKKPKKDKKTGNDIWWTATGAQFQVPYVFKKLFSGEKVEFDDFCETKACSTALYLDFNEGLAEDEHKYLFVGKVGRFCPIKAGCGGGLLFREKDGKYYAATGTTGYRWKESEVVKTLGLQKEIDISYYDRLCDEAIKTINEVGVPFAKDYDYLIADGTELPWD